LVDDKLAPFRSRVKNDRLEFASKQNQLKTLIDKMGEASTRVSGKKCLYYIVQLLVTDVMSILIGQISGRVFGS